MAAATAAASARISNIHLSDSAVRFKFANSDVESKHHISLRGVSKKCCLRHVLLEHDKRTLARRCLEVRKHWSPFHKARRMMYFAPFASTDDGIAVNGTPQTSSNNGMEEMRAKLNQSLQRENLSNGLVQSIHDAARAIELVIREHSSSSKTSWFSKTWLGVDKNAWVKTLSYQAAVYALLQAAVEISSRGDRSDRDTNIFVQRRLQSRRRIEELQATTV